MKSICCGGIPINGTEIDTYNFGYCSICKDHAEFYDKTKIEKVGIMHAELKVDCYAGKNCDEIKPEWHGYSEGNRGEEVNEVFTLDCKSFIPGTLLKIESPCCPRCSENPSFNEEDNEWICGCDFDWREWILNEYS